MDFTDLQQQRQSVRRYTERPVPADLQHRLVEAVRLAPSACNSQPWTVILVEEPQLRRQVARTTRGRSTGINAFAEQAPLLAVMVVEAPNLSAGLGALIKRRDYPLMDVAIAAEHLCLQAADLGLGTCLLGWFDEPRLKRLLRIPRRKRVALVITIGYSPADYPLRDKTRKQLSSLCRRDTYDGRPES